MEENEVDGIHNGLNDTFQGDIIPPEEQKLQDEVNTILDTLKKKGWDVIFGELSVQIDKDGHPDSTRVGYDALYTVETRNELKKIYGIPE